VPGDRRRRDGRAPVVEVFLVFLKLGLTAFGGPAAHVAMMESELVRRRAWLTIDELMDLVAITQLLPGPNSTELALMLGKRRAGLPGLLAAGVAFIVPAAVITAGLAWAYQTWGARPWALAPLRGIEAAVVAIVGDALWRFGKASLKTRRAWALGVLCVTLAIAGVSEVAILLGAGAVEVMARRAERSSAGLFLLAPVGAQLAFSAATPTSLFAVFFKIGGVLFGSGYVLVAFLRSEVVARGWISEAMLLDAVAAGQITPGPVFSTATFVGWLVAGGWGAAAATIGIFLPAFVLSAVSDGLVTKLMRRAAFRAVLDGVRVASLAVMAVAVSDLARAGASSVAGAVIVAGGLVALGRFAVHPTWVVVAGVVVSMVVG
jgi:chromate transporter